jgi:ADP-heptose:LPS heptosyltransferase
VYTLRVPRADRNEYVVRHRQRMLEHAGITVKPRLPRIFLSPAERMSGAGVVNALPKGPEGRRVAIVLSARAPGSIWPVDRFAALAERLAAEGNAPVVLPTSGDDDLVDQFLKLSPSARRADFPGLRAFVAGVASFDLLICGSTGPSHMGMAVGTPTITLFGADRSTTWNAGLETTVAVSSPRLTCMACAQGASRMAPSHTCMMEISVEQVADSARALLAATRTPSRSSGDAP